MLHVQFISHCRQTHAPKDHARWLDVLCALCGLQLFREGAAGESLRLAEGGKVDAQRGVTGSKQKAAGICALRPDPGLKIECL
jgi:hypothetical protein